MGNKIQISRSHRRHSSQSFGLNEGNIFNVVENCISNHTSGTVENCTIILSESQCAHELEKARLLLHEREKENGYLKEENARLKEFIELLKTRTGNTPN